MVDNSVLNLNGVSYLVVDVIPCYGGQYIYFANESDENDFFVKKQQEKNGKNYLVGLENNEEFVKAMQLFAEKHQND